MVATYEGWLLPRYRRRVALSVLVAVCGGQAITTQTVLVREALVLLYGSELAWGVVLSAWLLGVALGAVLGARAARRGAADLRLVAVLLTLSVLAGVQLWAFRGARAWLGLAAGELVPLPQTALTALGLVSPAGLLVGMAFPLACRVGRAWGAPTATAAAVPTTADPGVLGDTYAVESIGSLLGGAAFSFYAVEHLAPVQTVLLCAALTTAASAGLWATTGRARGAVLALLGGAGLALVAAAAGGAALDRHLVERRWRQLAPGYAWCTEVESKYQNLAVGQRAGQFTLYSNGQVAADFPDPYTFVPLAHFWMCQHPAPRRVLVLGGGAEGLLAEILRHPVEGVDYVEPDPRQIEILRPFLDPADRQALADPRVAVHHQDARYYIKTQRDRFDLVIARLPEPTSALRARFYTDEFYGELRRAMTARSVVCLTVAASPGELSEASGEYLASVRATLRRHFPEVVVGWGEPAHVLAGTAPELVATDPGILAARYAERRVTAPLFDPVWFEGATDWLEADKLRRRAAELDAVPSAPISTDLRPIVVVQRLALWERMTGGASGSAIARLRAVRPLHLALGLGLASAATVAAFRWRRRSAAGWAEGAVVLSVATTGFVTMALSLVWLFAFQNLYGYVYSRIGWIMAVFMGGLVVGCWRGRGRASRDAAGPQRPEDRWRRLMVVDLRLGLLALIVPLVLPALGALQGTAVAFVLVEWAVLLLVAVTGVLGGAAFALAGGLQVGLGHEAAAAAGVINGADHAGACLGALLCGLLLVPVMGITATALVLGGLKLGSAGVLWAGRRCARAG